jgi:hypothetical protein
VLDGGRSFQLVLDPSPSEHPVVALAGYGTTIEVSVECAASPHAGIALYTCVARDGSPGALYDLEVQAGGANARMPHAVAIPHRQDVGLLLLHCTDLHLIKPTPEGTLADRSALIRALVARIDTLQPDLVVCTGDLIHRYDAQSRALPANCIRWQIGHISALLAEVTVPLFITTGNHDVAFDSTRADWYKAVGGGWHGRTDDHSLDWGRAHLVLMDGFAHYDADNVQQVCSFTPEQICWLEQDLSAVPKGRLRLVFAHYDYQQQLPPLFRPLRIDGLFYGHSRAMYPEVFERTGVWDGHLGDTDAYSLLRITAEGIAGEKVTWTELEAQQGNPDPGA